MKEKNSKEGAVTNDVSVNRKKSSSMRPGVYIIIVLALIIVGGYFYSANQADNREELLAVNRQQSSDETYGSSDAGEEIDPVSKSDKIRKHFNSGVRFSQRRDFDKAIEEYSKALEINPEIAEIHSNLGFAYLDSGKVDLSISSQKKALELDTNLVNAYYGLALALEMKGDIEGARNNWEQYLESAPKNTIWWNKAKAKLEKIRSISE